MKRIFFLMLTLLIMSAVSMNAQVTIGSADNPDPSAVLELKSANLGFLLPRVALKSTEDKTTITNPAAGLTVYNTANAGSGTTAVVPGIYFFNGTAWTLQAPPVITTQPKSFSWSRLYHAIGDPLYSHTATVAALKVEASGNNLKYQWYKKAVNVNAVDTALAGATTNTYTPIVTDWGMKTYYCVISNDYGSVKSDKADVAIGCGAKTAYGGWLKFMCHNIGASPVGATQQLDEITFATNSTVAGGDTISSDAKGWLFQWGRDADGHQWRSSSTVLGPYRDSLNIQVPTTATDYYGKYILNPVANGGYNTYLDWRWPAIPSNAGIMSCSPPFYTPTKEAWITITKITGHHATFDENEINTWVWTGNGLVAKPDGVTATLYLPAAGYRDLTGTLYYNSVVGYYTVLDANAGGNYYLKVGSDGIGVFPNYRGRGFSLRCIWD